MLLRCEICQGTRQQFHPGESQPKPCWKCESLGNHVDAVIAWFRATDEVATAATVSYIVHRMFFSSLNCTQRDAVERAVSERLED
jgi:hypothetical protein